MRTLNPVHLVRPCPEFAEAVELLKHTGRYFMLDGQPHTVIREGRQMFNPEGFDKLASFLLFEEPEIIVLSPAGGPVPLTRTVVAEFARRLQALFGKRPDIWPNLRSYVRGPMYRREGDRLVRVPEGYDPLSQQLVLAPDLPGVLPTPAPGYPHLHTLFSGLEFADPVYKANLLGVCVALFCRTGMDEFPLLMIDATSKSSGKTTVLKTLGALLNGASQGAVTYSGSEEEFERRLGSYCNLPGPNLIPIDNIRVKKGAGYLVRSQTLASIVHDHVAKVRKLYSGPSMLFDAICVGTMNDAKVERDLADKCVVLTLTRPPGPDCHRQLLPYPPNYVKQWRMELLAEIFQIIERLQLPPIEGAKFHTRFYQFEQIVVGAARELGLEASFDPTRVRTVDAFIEQLFNLIYDTLPELAAEGAIPVDRLVKQIECNPGVTELNDVLHASSRASNGRTIAFRDHLANTVSGKRYKWHGKIISLTIDNSTLTLHNLD